MAIRMETTQDAYEARNETGRTIEKVENFHGANGTLYMETTAVGRVLYTGELNGYDDSDFYALVWDGERIVRRTYATTRGWTYANGASVDATDDVKEAAAKYVESVVRKLAINEIKADAVIPEKGRRVKVVSKRSKAPHGAEGTVIWYGRGRQFGYGTPPMRVGFKTDDGETYFVSATVVEVVDPDFSIDEKRLAAFARDRRYNWSLGVAAVPGFVRMTG